MGDFVQAVRNSRIAQPPQRSFSLQTWECAFTEVDSPDSIDRMVYDIGKWAYGCLEDIRSQIAALPIGDRRLRDSAKLICGAVNLAARDLFAAQAGLVGGPILISEGLIQARLPATALRSAASPDELLTQIIDGARYPLVHSLSTSEVELETAPDQVDLAIIKVLIQLGEYYDIAEGIWAEALWGGLEMRDLPGVVAFAPTNMEYSENRSVSVYRRNMLMNQAVQYAVGFWKRLPLARRQADVKAVPRVRITGTGTASSMEVHYSTEGADKPPLAIIMRVLWQDEYLRDLTTTEFPNHPGICVEHLIAAWYTLRSLAETTVQQYPAARETLVTFDEILPYARGFARACIVGLVAQALSCTRDVAEKVVSLLLFRPDPRCEPWMHPLVETASGELTLLVGPLLFGSILRCVEHWLKIGGVNLESKGPEFEDEVRQALAASARDSKIRDSIYVHATPMTFQARGISEEIDLVIGVGSCLVIGEAKCQPFPVDPLDYFDYHERLRAAAIQVSRKADLVRGNLSTFVSQLSMPHPISEDTLRIVPCVVPNQPFGAGFPVDGVAVSDIPILVRYLEGKWEQFVTFDGDESYAGKTTVFYDSPDEAGSRFPDYLLDPPQIRFLRQSVQTRTLRLPSLSRGRPSILNVTMEVRLPTPGADAYDPQRTDAPRA